MNTCAASGARYTWGMPHNAHRQRYGYGYGYDSDDVNAMDAGPDFNGCW